MTTQTTTTRPRVTPGSSPTHTKSSSVRAPLRVSAEVQAPATSFRDMQVSAHMQGCITVIFGATGDLTRRMLLPALYDLSADNLLPDNWALVGFALSDPDRPDFVAAARQSVGEFSRHKTIDEKSWAWFSQRVSFLPSDFDDPSRYEELARELNRLDDEYKIGGNRLFYLAVPPTLAPTIVKHLKAAGLAQSNGWSRVIMEKPFGHDLKSARALNDVLHAAFREEQVYRIDHYLAKEAVQNLLVFRFANTLFEPAWNRNYVDHVQLTVAESVGTAGRSAYYEKAGALRDMVQSHMLQVLALVAMEPPSDDDPNAIRDEKVKLLRAIRQMDHESVAVNTVRGQYTAGFAANHDVAGYRNEQGVAHDSQTETFVALRLFIDNLRWQGVPFYLRTGKALPMRASEISLHLKDVPRVIFRGTRGVQPTVQHNIITIALQPEEGISVRISTKVPGTKEEIQPVEMAFSYDRAFQKESPPAYERLLLDTFAGDPTLFTRHDEVETSWRLIDSIRSGWDVQDADVEPYFAGAWGPRGAQELIAADGRRWHTITLPT